MPAYPGSAGRAGGGAAVILLCILSCFQEKENLKKVFLPKHRRRNGVSSPFRAKRGMLFCIPRLPEGVEVTPWTRSI